jgi:ATP-binding cassette subfamily F protein uup
VFEGPGIINEYVGGYRDWLRQRADSALQKAPASTPKPARPTPAQRPQQTELRTLPGKIEKLEAKIEALQLRFAATDYYQQEASLIRADQQQLQTLETDLAALYRRWEELEG